MTSKGIDKIWYENEKAGYTICQVNYPGRCFVAEDDPFYIEFVSPGTSNKVRLKYGGTDKTNIAFWGNANADYDPDSGVIIGSTTVTLPDGSKQSRNFSIALDRGVFVRAFRIHVYVSKRGEGSPTPDDGSWTGNGK